MRKWGGSQAEFRGLAELRRQQCEFRELKIAFWRECRFVRQELQKSAWRSLGVFTENRDKHVEDACSRGRQRLWAAWFAELTPALGTIHYSQSYHWWVSNSLGPPVETLERPHRAAVKQSKGYSGPTLAKLNNKPWKNESDLWVVNCPSGTGPSTLQRNNKIPLQNVKITCLTLNRKTLPNKPRSRKA